MKLRTTIFTTLIALFCITAIAQAQEKPVVKVLPSKDDHLKILYVDEKPVDYIEVKFYNAHRIIKKDKIKGSRINGGFLRRYDLRKLPPGNYWVEVSTDEIITRYKFSAFEEQPLWVSWWQNYLPGSKAIASRLKVEQ